MKRKYIFPILYAAILFLVIRIANDVPNGYNYLNHTCLFMLIEILGVVGSCYLLFWLGSKWVVWCLNHKCPSWVEFFFVMVVPMTMAVLVCCCSHGVMCLYEVPALVIPVVVTVLMSLWLYLSMKYSYVEHMYSEQCLRNAAIRSEQLKTEMQLLRSQFHPHFLFNMLNTVYFRIHEDNAEARETVEHLANLLRRQIYSGSGAVPVSDEISTMNSFIELARLRLGDKLNLEVDIDSGLGSELVHPYLFIPLVENAFKYCGGSYCIIIRLLRICGGLEFYVKNTVDTFSPKFGNGQGDGQGLKNLRRRLALAYPDRRHVLDVMPSENEFTVKLQIMI